MALLLDTLKRIEAKKARLRAPVVFVPVVEPPCEPDLELPYAAAPVALAEREAVAATIDTEPFSEAVPHVDAHEGPSHRLDGYTLDLCLADAPVDESASLDAAIDHISELVAEVRQFEASPIESPVVAVEDIPAEPISDPPVESQLESLAAADDRSAIDLPNEPLVTDDTAGVWQEILEMSFDLPEELDDVSSIAIAEPDAVEQPQLAEPPQPAPEVSHVAELAATETTDPFATDDNWSDVPAATTDQAESAEEPIAEEAVADDDPVDDSSEPPVIEPVGTDPYAAAAWQIVRQLPEGRSRVVLFTSPGDGHGTTTTLARLAPHLARCFEGNVLIVDANARNPEMARWLDVAATWRLPEVLAGATDWMNAVRPTEIARVSLLPGGTDNSRRVNVQAAARLFRDLAAHYDLVLVDAASLAHASAASLLGICDAAYLVVRLGEGSHRLVREAVRVVSRGGGRLLGCLAVDAGE